MTVEMVNTSYKIRSNCCIVRRQLVACHQVVFVWIVAAQWQLVCFFDDGDRDSL